MPQPSDSFEQRDSIRDPDQQPLVGVVVHWLIVLWVLIGCGLAGWAIAGPIPALLFGLAACVLWFGTFAIADPERLPTARLRIAGPLRIGLEVVLVAIAAAGIWIVWNRAASETFITVAAIDFAVRYQRIAKSFRSVR